MPSSLPKTIFSNDISLTPLCKEHLAELALSLQAQDYAEMWAAYRLPVSEVLSLCYQKSAISLAFVYQGKVCAVAGVEADSLLGGRGCLWSWTSGKVKKIPKLFWKISKSVLAYFLSVYPCLYVLCDNRYLQARRYIVRLGGSKRSQKIMLAGKETYFELYQFARSHKDLKKIKEEKWEEL